MEGKALLQRQYTTERDSSASQLDVPIAHEQTRLCPITHLMHQGRRRPLFQSK